MLYYCNCISTFAKWWGKLTWMHGVANAAVGQGCFKAYLAARVFFYSTLRGTIQNLQYHGGRGHSWQGIGMNARFFDKKKAFPAARCVLHVAEGPGTTHGVHRHSGKQHGQWLPPHLNYNSQLNLIYTLPSKTNFQFTMMWVKMINFSCHTVLFHQFWKVFIVNIMIKYDTANFVAGTNFVGALLTILFTIIWPTEVQSWIRSFQLFLNMDIKKFFCNIVHSTRYISPCFAVII